MKFISLLLFAAFAWGCSKEPEPPQVEEDPIKLVRLKEDSLTLTLKYEKPVPVQTAQGDTMWVTLKNVDNACAPEECRFCDIELGVYAQVNYRGKQYQLPDFSFMQCGYSMPRVFVAPPCSYCNDRECPASDAFFIKYNQLILSIHVVTPYPTTRVEYDALFRDKSLYTLRLTIQNQCI